MILIVGGRGDLHCRHVANRIEAAGGSATLLDLGALAAGTRLSFELGPAGAAGHLDGVDLDDVRAVWLRRPAAARVPDDVSDAAARAFVRHEWSAAVNGTVLAHDRLRWVNDPFAQNAASKPLQLARARAAGLAVPDTLVTNDPRRAREFVRERDGNVIHKVLTYGEDLLLDTRAWDGDRDDALLDDTLPVAPVIFQERVHGGVDVRCVVVGDTVLSVAVDTAGSRADVDSRLDPDAAYRVHELPPDTARGLRALMAALGLVYGVVDLKIDERGRYVFLEVNPQGQFLFMEILTGIPVSDTLAAFLLSGRD